MHRIRFLTVIGDTLILIIGFIAAYFLRVGFIFSSDLPFAPYFVASVLSSMVWVVSLLIFRGYQMGIRLTRRRQILKILIAGIAGTGAFGFLYYFLEKAVFSRLLFFSIFILGSVLSIFWHFVAQTLEDHVIQKGIGTTRLLLIGSNRGVEALIKKLQEGRSPYVPVAILDGYGTSLKSVAGVPILGKLNILEDTISRLKIDGIIQGDNLEQTINIVQFCKQKNLQYFLLPYLLGMFQEQLQLQYLEQPLLTSHFQKKSSLIEKLLGS